MPVSTTRTLVLIPVAIALNIALGSTVQQVLKLPIYLDSVGTVITGVLAGPFAGLATGVLTNLIWAYVLPPPLAAPTAGPFAITAAVIGLLAGLWGRLGLFRSRPASEAPVLLGAVGVAVAVAILVAYTFTRAYASQGTFKSVTGAGPDAFGPSEVAFGVVVAAFVGLAAWALFARRDAGAVTALAAGLVTGLVAAVVSAPISAYVFGGVTGFGGDVVVAAFRAAGANLYQATLQQGLLSDPLDKMITCLLVFLVLAAMPRRVVARFPNGERLVESD
jgi:energy-coupling factor transport system substrate-specific component